MGWLILALHAQKDLVSEAEIPPYTGDGKFVQFA